MPDILSLTKILMAIATTTRLQRALSPAENALVADSLSLLTDWKLQLTALASLRSAELCETGALILLRGKLNDGFALILLDTVRGDTLWLQALSAHSNLVCTTGPARHYLLTDGELNGSVEITFGDEEEEAVVSRNILKACRRLAKRVKGESLLHGRTYGGASASPKETSTPGSAETSILPRKHFVSSSPLTRRWILQSTPESVREDQHYNSASPVMELIHTDDSNSSRRIGVETTCQGKVERWLHMTTLSGNQAKSPSISSAFPRVSTHPPPEELIGTDEADGRRCPSSCPRVCSIPTILLNQPHQLHSSLRKYRSRTWRATIGDKDFEIPDVTDEITGVCDGIRTDEGGFGYIRQGRLHGQDVALKQMKLSKEHTFSKIIKMAESKRYRKEVVVAMLCARMRHQNIVEFKGVAISETLGACLVFPWMKNGNSISYVKSNAVPRIPIIHGASEGLAFLHKKGFVHGDMKAQNVLISDEGIPLLCDFGLASCTEVEEEESSNSIQRAGNAQWKAPELLDDDIVRMTRMSDMWAFGMFAIEILTENLPFPGRRRASIYLAIHEDNLPQRPASSECSDALWDLIRRCWTKSASDRITAGQALDILNKLKDGGQSSSVA